MTEKMTGNQIKEIIKNTENLTQTELAKKCGVSKSSVSYWLNEKREIPDAQYIIITEYLKGVNNMSTSQSKVNKVNTEEKDTKYEEIKKDLLDQLENKNKYGTHYEDLVSHAVYLFELKDQLQQDIEKNGLRIEMATGNGHVKEVDNASIRHLNQVSAQLLRVLKDFGLDEPNLDNDDINDEDYT